jgi:hypothetical protein
MTPEDTAIPNLPTNSSLQKAKMELRERIQEITARAVQSEEVIPAENNTNEQTDGKKREDEKNIEEQSPIESAEEIMHRQVEIAKRKAQAAAALAMKQIASTSHTIPPKHHQPEQEHTNEDRKKRGDTTQEENVDKSEKGKKTVHWEKSIATKATEYTEDEKKLWTYISNVELEGGEQGWKPQHDSW